MAEKLQIREAVFDEPSVQALVERHNEFCMEETSPCKMHRLSLDQLQGDDLRFWTLWQDGEAIGCIALRDLGEKRGEVKSMHVLEVRRGGAWAQILLDHLFEEARRMGMNWLGLETGETPNFERAIAFYRKNGFAPAQSFGHYNAENSGVLMARGL